MKGLGLAGVGLGAIS
ncbi:MAG: hypothetical protein ACXABY_35355, partial [Candidatus Thorarchaeota archaeon]